MRGVWCQENFLWPLCPAAGPRPAGLPWYAQNESAFLLAGVGERVHTSVMKQPVSISSTRKPRRSKAAAAVAPERRRHGRYSAAGQATLCWRGFSGENCATRGQVRNVSAQGLAIQVHEPVAVGQTIRVRLEQADFSAFIRSCRDQGTGFLAGLELVVDEAQFEQSRKRWAWWFRHTWEIR